MMEDGSPMAIFRCVALSAFDRLGRFDRARDLSPSSPILCARLIKAINDFKVPKDFGSRGETLLLSAKIVV